MLKKILDGALFGLGFAVAVVVVWIAATMYVMPKLWESRYSSPETKEPEFSKPTEAQVATPKPGAAPDKREFSFFKHGRSKMEIPQGGGILSMSPISTAQGANRPSSYQLWLTESKLWQIRTIEDKTEFEELPYPKADAVAELGKLMHRSLGLGARQSTMTVSAFDVDALRTKGETSRDETLNGKLRISVEGVVFIQPNPYGQQR
jgi:hypothetical protein